MCLLAAREVFLIRTSRLCRLETLTRSASESIRRFSPDDRRSPLLALRASVCNRSMAAFTHHIFICTNRRESGSARGCCNPDGSEALRNAFKKEVERRGLKPLVRANSAGCLDQCELGPTVVIYPQAIWYGGVKLEDVPRIVEETVIGGRVIEELRIPDAKLNCRK